MHFVRTPRRFWIGTEETLLGQPLGCAEELSFQLHHHTLDSDHTVPVGRAVWGALGGARGAAREALGAPPRTILKAFLNISENDCD